MSQRGVEGLLGRLITDKAFRDRFYEEPAAVCVAEAMEVTTRELEAILALQEPRIADFSRHLDTRIVRAIVNGEHQRRDAGTARSTVVADSAPLRARQQRAR